MRALGSIGTPIDPTRTHMISNNVLLTGRYGSRSGLRGGSTKASGCQQSCTGNGCSCSGMHGLRATSLDQLVASGFSWLTGAVQASLPASAAVPPQYGSTGAIATQITSWLPYLVGAFLIYKVISK